MLRQNVSALDYTARHQDTLDTPRAIQLYFNELSELRGPDAVDKHGILDAFSPGVRSGAATLPFAQVAEEFRLIENAARTVYLPVGEGAASVSSCAAVMLPGRCCGSWRLQRLLL